MNSLTEVAENFQCIRRAKNNDKQVSLCVSEREYMFKWCAGLSLFVSIFLVLFVSLYTCARGTRSVDLTL